MAGTQKAMPRAIAPQGRGSYGNHNQAGSFKGYAGKHSNTPVFTSKGPVRIPPPEQQHTITREFGQDPAGAVSGTGNTTSALGSGVGP